MLQKGIEKVDQNMINYATKCNYSFSHWENIVNMMVLKEEGNYKINRFWVIHLYKADLNFILGLKWKEDIYKSVNTPSLFIQRNMVAGQAENPSLLLSSRNSVSAIHSSHGHLTQIWIIIAPVTLTVC